MDKIYYIHMFGAKVTGIQQYFKHNINSVYSVVQ